VPLTVYLTGLPEFTDVATSRGGATFTRRFTTTLLEPIDDDDVIRGWSRARPEATRHVERLLERLPEKERQMLDVMAGLPPDQRPLTNIAREMGYEAASQAGPTAMRLDANRGIIERRGRSEPYVFRSRIVAVPRLGLERFGLVLGTASGSGGT